MIFSLMVNILTIFLLLLTVNINTYVGQTNAGARQAALAHSDIAISNNVFGIFNNPSSSANLNSREIGVFYSPSPFGVKELAHGNFAYIEPTSIGNFSIGASTYGFELYRENQFSLSYSTKVTEKILLGITTFYHDVKIDRYGSSGIFNIKFGGIFALNNNLSIGFSLHNPFRFLNSQIELPLVYNLGLSYTPIKNVNINLALFKELNFPVSVRFGIEYPLIKYLHLRIGVQNEPDLYSGGIGIIYTFLNLNYAVTSHPELGLTHLADLIIKLN